MTQTITKARIVKVVEALPDDATLEDAIERLVFLHKVQTGLQQAGQGKSQADVEVEFAKPRHQRQW